MTSGGKVPAAKADKKLVVLAGDEDCETCRTFIFKEESHTLGNALKSVILKNPNVSFCGYSIPHPAENQMFLRVQTVEGYPAQDALRKGLKDLKEMCQITKKKFLAEAKDQIMNEVD